MLVSNGGCVHVQIRYACRHIIMNTVARDSTVWFGQYSVMTRESSAWNYTSKCQLYWDIATIYGSKNFPFVGHIDTLKLEVITSTNASFRFILMIRKMLQLLMNYEISQYLLQVYMHSITRINTANITR